MILQMRISLRNGMRRAHLGKFQMQVCGDGLFNVKGGKVRVRKSLIYQLGLIICDIYKFRGYGKIKEANSYLIKI